MFKITHISPFGIPGNFVLGFGLAIEAIIFFIAAFDPPHETMNYQWENVYPELLDEKAVRAPKKANQVAEVKELEASLSSKLDKMLADAKLDVALFDRLRTGIDKFSESVDQINHTVDVSSTTTKYNDQLTLAASHLESMNALYQIQIEHGRQQSDFSRMHVENLKKSAEFSTAFNTEMSGLTTNINSLNKVYGGMLNAMKA